jgi:hypothetical protein
MSEQLVWRRAASAKSGPTPRLESVLRLKPWPDEQRVARVLEMPERRPLKGAEFVLDFSERDLGGFGDPADEIHGSYLTSYQDVFLFGPNLIFDASGRIACEFRVDCRQFLEYANSDYFRGQFPGHGPRIEILNEGINLIASGLRSDEIVEIREPVFLATPVEPANWGRWILTVAPKVAKWKRTRAENERLLCYADASWQRKFLNFFGIDDDRLTPHSPGQLHFCRKLHTIEYSNAALSVSARERGFFLSLAKKVASERGPRPEKLFLSRRSLARAFPDHRVLQNERNLIHALEALGFATIEPQHYELAEQIALLHSAKLVVALSGAALFNLVFCKPGTRVVILETDKSHATGHSALIASLGLDYGVIFGRQSPTDPTPTHKRWRLPIGKTIKAIREFL